MCPWCIRIGNQTAFSAESPELPFNYAIEHSFDSFEWFPDKKDYGQGWLEGDINNVKRCEIRAKALMYDISLSVHAPVTFNPLRGGSAEDFTVTLDFALDIGASLINIHLFTEEGIPAFTKAIVPLIELTSKHGLKLSIENTTTTSPEDFNELFSVLKTHSAEHVGMCLDIGHANVFYGTRNNFLRYMDLLLETVPIIHLHIHENYGDVDSHLTIFTGPSAENPLGMKCFIKRLKMRNFTGMMVLEQWPSQPSLLNTGRDKLLELIQHEENKP
ncbi:sugar phosphate isomerase/epimerase family protein [Candidatus Magnetomonas plexicatena]|uniref:sugar phosphate isomerase/epimerase family protein n=1 Tax=Candidatus Magnetomonas plexicatena TaxID=2552947 RepID=UPI001C764FD1|nr:TIM barrel protein [Nitrospirales bacterium LBB_01]